MAISLHFNVDNMQENTFMTAETVSQEVVRNKNCFIVQTFFMKTLCSVIALDTGLCQDSSW